MTKMRMMAVAAAFGLAAGSAFAQETNETPIVIDPNMPDAGFVIVDLSGIQNTIANQMGSTPDPDMPSVIQAPVGIAAEACATDEATLTAMAAPATCVAVNSPIPLLDLVRAEIEGTRSGDATSEANDDGSDEDGDGNN